VEHANPRPELLSPGGSVTVGPREARAARFAAAVADEADAAVAVLTAVHVLGDVLPQVATDRLLGASHWEELGAAEAIGLSCAPPERPLGPELGGGAAIVPPSECSQIGAGADVPADVNEQVVVDASRLLPLKDSDDLAVAGSEDVGGQGIQPALCFLRVEDVIGEGEGQEPAAVDAVLLAERLDVVL